MLVVRHSQISVDYGLVGALVIEHSRAREHVDFCWRIACCYAHVGKSRSPGELEVLE
jgi:hypothetical protein